ncbi:hypothetical protein [Ramlibacter sp.]|uniref:hypothetical protein n=1 Tax=Ramlibacter sp. TaxID=1917967 RepID=UPI002FCB8D81
MLVCRANALAILVLRQRLAGLAECHCSHRRGFTAHDIASGVGARALALGAFAAAIIAAATALSTPFTALAAAFAPSFASALLAITVTAGFLGGPVLSLHGSLATHGCGHGGLVGQCEILLYRIARDAVAAFAAVAVTTALATAVGATFAAGLAFAAIVSAGFRACFPGGTLLACAFAACFGTAFTAFAAATLAPVAPTFRAALRTCLATSFTTTAATTAAIAATAL